MHLKLSHLVFLLIVTALVDTKRSRGAIGLWSNKRKGSSGVQVRRTKVEHTAPKEPAIKSGNLEQANKPVGSNVDNSELNKKVRKSPKFKEKRSAGSYPYDMGPPGINREYNDIEGYGDMDGLKKSSDKQVFRNILDGVFVWYLVSGVVSRPYKVYNFYNQPKERAEIILPANILTSCNDNATEICIPGTVAICTQDSKILCIIPMTSTSPCQNNSEEQCVNCTIPCLDEKDPLCQNKSQGDNTTIISLTCFASMTLENGQSPWITLPKNEDNQFCVTTMAVPDPDPHLSVEEVKSVEDSDYEVDDNTGWDSNNLEAGGYNRYMVAVINH